MTNAELIAKIKSEVERLQDIYADAAQMYPTDEERFSYAACAVEFGDAVYSFLSTLESEKPMNQEGLEDEIKRYLREECSDDDEPGIHEIAEHFAQWGAEWQKEQMMKEAVAVEVVGDKRDLRLIDSTQRCLFNAKRGDWLKIIIVKE